MATIRAVRGKKSINYEVRIRRKGVSRIRVFKTRLAAEEYGMRVEADMLGDKYVAHDPLADLTLGSLLTRYSTSKTPKKKDARQEQGRIKQLLAHPISARSLQSLGSTDFADFRDEMEADDYYAPSTINKFLFLISGVYVTALGEWGFDALGLANPITNIDKCAVDPSGSGRRISPKEEKTILDLLDIDMQDLVGLAACAPKLKISAR